MGKDDPDTELAVIERCKNRMQRMSEDIARLQAYVKQSQDINKGSILPDLMEGCDYLGRDVQRYEDAHWGGKT